MAKRRKAKVKTVYRSIGKRIKRYGKKATSFSNPLQIDSMLYGGIRAKISTALDPILSKIPLGNVSDEVGMGILNYFIAKKTSGMIRNIALKGLVIENARVGEAILSGNFLGSITNNNVSTGYTLG